jgi:hypothetical protein
MGIFHALKVHPESIPDMVSNSSKCFRKHGRQRRERPQDELGLQDTCDVNDDHAMSLCSRMSPMAEISLVY